MRSLRLVPVTAVALMIASSVAQAAPASYHHHAMRQFANDQSANTTGRTWATPSASYPASELAPACLQGPPACTAAGYPNLHYYQEMMTGQ